MAQIHFTSLLILVVVAFAARFALGPAGRRDPGSEDRTTCHTSEAVIEATA